MSQDADFVAMLDGTRSADVRLQAAWDAYQPLRDWLANNPIYPLPRNGSGADTDACTDTSDCGANLYCSAGGTCAASGTVDRGDACVTTADCRRGYICLAVFFTDCGETSVNKKPGNSVETARCKQVMVTTWLFRFLAIVATQAVGLLQIRWTHCPLQKVLM